MNNVLFVIKNYALNLEEVDKEQEKEKTLLISKRNKNHTQKNLEVMAKLFNFRQQKNNFYMNSFFVKLIKSKMTKLNLKELVFILIMVVMMVGQNVDVDIQGHIIL